MKSRKQFIAGLLLSFSVISTSMVSANLNQSSKILGIASIYADSKHGEAISAVMGFGVQAAVTGGLLCGIQGLAIGGAIL